MLIEVAYWNAVIIYGVTHTIKHSAIFSKITDVSINYYDEIAISRIAVPEWDVEFFGEADDGVSWETFFNGAYNLRKNIFVKLVSNDGVIATGDVYEWESALTENTIKLKVQTRNNLEKEMNYHKTYTSSAISSGSSSLSEVISNVMLRPYINYLLDSGSNDTGVNANSVTFYGNNFAFFGHISNLIANKLQSGATNNYFLQITSSHQGSVKNFFKKISQFCNAKFTQTNEWTYLLSKFNSYYDDPIEVTGFVKSVNYSEQEENYTDDIFTEIRYGVVNGGSWSITGEIKNIIKSVLMSNQVHKYKEYEIWGYANTLSIKSGMAISINNVPYYVKDINYDTETLDSIKSFNATCVRFI